jgi:hypothetical protein
MQMKTKLITLLVAFVCSWNTFAQEETCQNLYFNEGWNLFSTYVQIEDHEAEFFFLDINDNFFIAKGVSLVFLYEFGANFGLEIHNDQGYFVKMHESDTLTHCGNQIIPEEYPITLEQGWNIMPYLRDTPQDAEEALSSIISEIHLVKNMLGQVYMPSWEYNGIGDLEPGKGYQIKMNAEQTLIYDANED